MVRTKKGRKKMREKERKPRGKCVRTKERKMRGSSHVFFLSFSLLKERKSVRKKIEIKKAMGKMREKAGKKKRRKERRWKMREKNPTNDSFCLKRLIPQGFKLLRQGQVYHLAPEALLLLGKCRRGLRNFWNRGFELRLVSGHHIWTALCYISSQWGAG